ncbi:uncharacterized protein Z519_00166 [Cladophialophora bantiana CBS 173.52]|uniref:tRNA (uracil-O(2)-)-methyltransferase n=1 Tax=Cladophialophora bantiana (strain ATCC 10958 / CBS 173.52 / CDC B-1940 / NIH 8579) TaxID=1442370 RepID=A0A0D2I5J9_CLAB1|nr:uncharacterized protein Z519_00166 [Cladophialophora bantiana CBS 173.52]KIW98505.1 hypothetical protein Z519_00166 [Cladophialophora bantiana CBS 173.52]
MALDRLITGNREWKTAPEYSQSCVLSADRFLQVTDLLLENPNLNSTHLFRADILYDSVHRLKTVSEKESFYLEAAGVLRSDDKAVTRDEPEPVSSAPVFQSAILQRKILRKLIPRKPQLDRSLDQWCYIYKLIEGTDDGSGCIVVYEPQVDTEADMPWYHPPVKSVAYLRKEKGTETTLSVHFLPFSTSPDPLPSRTQRTFVSLLQTFLRLAKNPAGEKMVVEDSRRMMDGKALTTLSLAPSALKDTILPQHTVQDTYTRLKERHAHDLISRWAEKTEPSKHVFEDLAIAAFVIELWNQMYPKADAFPGFVDIACGNGVLTYVLVKEGYQGRGFDVRRRTTWDVLEMDDYLDEMVCIPQPFLDHVGAEEINGLQEAGTRIHNGIFKPGTFIISNHADELTPWTPLLATLSSPDSPLPFLAIPCCSHALSGAKHRYSPKDASVASLPSDPTTDLGSPNAEHQPASGDLRALRATKSRAANHADDTSMYACLTKKVISLALEVGNDVELTLMRIPSTRNIGVVGNRRQTWTPPAAANSGGGTIPPAAAIHPAPDERTQRHSWDHAVLSGGTEKIKKQQEAAHENPTTAGPRGDGDETQVEADGSPVQTAIRALLDRECAMAGGVAEAARCWVARAHKHQVGRGRGKVNLGARPLAGG